MPHNRPYTGDRRKTMSISWRPFGAPPRANGRAQYLTMPHDATVPGTLLRDEGNGAYYRVVSLAPTVLQRTNKDGAPICRPFTPKARTAPDGRRYCTRWFALWPLLPNPARWNDEQRRRADERLARRRRAEEWYCAMVRGYRAIHGTEPEGAEARQMWREARKAE